MRNNRMLKILVGIFFTIGFSVPAFATKNTKFIVAKDLVEKKEDKTSIFSYLYRYENGIDLGYVNTRRFKGGKKDPVALIRAKCMIKNGFLRIARECGKIVKYLEKHGIKSLKEMTSKKHFGPILKLELEYKEEQKKKIKLNLSGWVKYVKTKEFKDKYKERRKIDLDGLKANLEFSLKSSNIEDEKTKEEKKKLEEKIKQVKKDLENLKDSKYLKSDAFKEFAKMQKEASKTESDMLNLEITHIKKILDSERLLEISRKNFAKYVKEADKDEKSNFDEDIKKIIKGEKIVGSSSKVLKMKTKNKKNVKNEGKNYKIKNL